MIKVTKNKFFWILTILLFIFLWWTISPLFIDSVVNDELPNQPEIGGSDQLKSGSETSAQIQGPFSITDTPTHPATGSVRVIKGPDETVVRFEDYDGTNGPDLRIYLTNDLKASKFVDLGEAKGNKGNINYTVPSDININEYRYVVTWCRAFGVLFDYAEIN